MPWLFPREVGEQNIPTLFNLYITYEEELVYSRPKVITLTHVIKNLTEVIISRDQVAVTG